jgi:hypothetical protein
VEILPSVTPLDVAIFALVTAYVSVPLLTLAHELGHALAAVRLTGQRVTVRIGDEPGLARFALGRIDVRWHPIGHLAYCELSLGGSLAPREQLRFALAGPAAEALAALMLAVAAVGLAAAQGTGLPFAIVAAAAVGGLARAALNLLPLEHPPSWLGPLEAPGTDGWQIRELVRR